MKNLPNIPAGNQYEGYLWKSDAEKPDVFHPGDDFTDNFSPTAIPYIVEGWLYDRAASVSYAIRYLDGNYIRIKYKLAETDKRITYQAHDLQPVTHFRVAEHWSLKPDPNCAGMEVLRHAWTAFAGFSNTSNK